MPKAEFGRTIIEWYLENKRELPWRNTRDPYRIWLSEVLLQQTRVAQGLPYYQRFVEQYPTIFDLARAPETEVLKLWQGLGYYSRARNLLSTARFVAEECDGVFPDTYRELMRLNGIGPYTAAAIASFCFDEAVPVFDGNVYRVLSRYFGIREPVNSSSGRRELEALGWEVMSEEAIALYNQGIMEFGALQCKPKSPACTQCPLQGGCRSLSEGVVAELPIKLKKAPVLKLHFNYLVFRDPKRYTLIERRPAAGIWPGLFQFPLWESEARKGPEEVGQYLRDHWAERVGRFGLELALSLQHRLSHRDIRSDFWWVDTELPLSVPEAVSWTSVVEYPVPVLIERFMETVDFH